MTFYKEICTGTYYLLKFNYRYLRSYCRICIRLIIFIILFIIISFIFANIYYSIYCQKRFRQGLLEAQQRRLWNVNQGVRDEFLPILMPTCDRPHYLEQVLNSLQKIDGINQTLLVVSQDCAQHTISSLLQNYSISIRILILPHKPPYFSLPRFVYTNEYATSANVKFLLEFAFEHMLADGAILLESDLVPSVDFYCFYQWTHRYILSRNYSNVLSIHSFNIDSKKTSDPYTLSSSNGFDSWGWSTERTRWPWLKTYWTKFKNWDITLNHEGKQDQWIFLRATLSRTRMIGFQGINVKIRKKVDKDIHENVYISDKQIDYRGKIPKIRK